MVAMASLPTPRPALRAVPRRVVIDYYPYGAARELFGRRDREILLDGPAGTGKSVACLNKLHLAASRHPGLRGLMVRKTRSSLTQTGMVTFERKVLHPADGVEFHGGDQEYRYPNGSVIIVGGLDKSSKVMSSEYDMIYVQESTELSEADLEDLTTRLRNGQNSYQQLIADCNPAGARHWLKQRCDRGATVPLYSRHEDNPTLWDRDRGRWTPAGVQYIAILDALTGPRKDRLRYGRWVDAEGVIYAFDQARHLTSQEAIQGIIDAAVAAGRSFGVGDWGWSNPGGLQVYVYDGDDRLYEVAEYYHTQRHVDSWWTPRAVDLTRQYNVQQWFLDPSEPAFIQKFRDAGLRATGADNAIAPGINAVQDRLRIDATGRPRLIFCADALIERDERLVDLKQPISAVQEFDSYVWAKTSDGRSKDVPASGLADHGLDQIRYACMAMDAMSRRRGTPATALDIQRYVEGPFSDPDPYGDAWETEYE